MLRTEQRVFLHDRVQFRWIGVRIEIQLCFDVKRRFQLTNKSQKEPFALNDEHIGWRSIAFLLSYVFDDRVDAFFHLNVIVRLFIVLAKSFDDVVKTRFPQLRVEILRQGRFDVRHHRVDISLLKCRSEKKKERKSRSLVVESIYFASIIRRKFASMCGELFR